MRKESPRKSPRTAGELAKLQAEIAERVAAGKTYRRVAQELRISKDLVSYHMGQMRREACCGCGQLKKIKCRGLCQRCYYDPEIAALHARARKFSPRGDASKPTFPWSMNPKLFPCMGCIREGVPFPGGKCKSCAKKLVTA